MKRGLEIAHTEQSSPFLSIQEYAMLAERHMQHDLEPSDRDLLKTAAKKLGTHTTVGASLGLGLGLLLTYRLRRATYQIYNAARSVEKPVAFQFKDGHTVPFPQNATDAFRPCAQAYFTSEGSVVLIVCLPCDFYDLAIPPAESSRASSSELQGSSSVAS